MRRVLASAACIAIIGWLAFVPTRASAEGLLDIYAGGTFTSDSGLTFNVDGDDLGPFPASWDDGWAVGIRGGYWFEGPMKWLGLALDLSYFPASESLGVLDIHLLPLTPTLMLRVPLFTRNAHPGGRIQPYAAVGPGFYISLIAEDLFFASAVGFDVGLDARGGVAVQLIRQLGLFVEYRYSSVDVKITDALNDTVKTKFETNHINAGLALRF